MHEILLNPYKYNSGIIARFLFFKISQIIKIKFQVKNYFYILFLYIVFGLLGISFAFVSMNFWFPIFILFYLFLNVFLWNILLDEKYLAEFYFFRRYEQIIRDFLDVLILGSIIFESYIKIRSISIILLGFSVILINYILDYVGVINLLMAPKSLTKENIIEIDEKYFSFLQTLPFGRDIIFLVLGIGLFFFNIILLFILLIVLGIILFLLQNYYFLNNVYNKKKQISEDQNNSELNFKISLEEIKKKAVKSKEGFYAYYNNLCALRLAPWFYKRAITPNQVTILGFIFSVLSMMFFLMPFYFFGIIGSLFLILSFLMDGVDGTLARWTGKTSYFGGWLDRVLDRIADILVVVGIGIGQYFYTNNFYILYFTFLAVLGQIIYCRAYDTLVIGGYLVQEYPKLKTSFIYEWFLKKNFLLGFRRDMCFLTIIICSFLNKLSYALVIIFLGQTIEWLIRSYRLAKRRNLKKALDYKIQHESC